jgi:ribonuclease E
MAKRMLIDAAHPEETRVVVLNNNRLEEFDFETSTKKQIKGNIYLAKVTRVEPSLQAAFVEYGGNRHGFLAFNEIHPDYYRIPVSDRAPSRDHAARSADEMEDGAEDTAEGTIADTLDEAGTDSEPSPDDTLDETAAGAEPLFDRGENDSDSDGPDETDEADHPEAVAEAAPPSPDERAVAAEAHDDDVLYDDHDEDQDPESEGGIDARPGHAAIEDGAGEITEPSAAAMAMLEAAPAEAAEGDSGNGVAPESAEPDGNGEERQTDTIETVGGDEIEEAAERQRARPYRHYKIQEVIKRRQIMLVQVTKEERGNKGAALTTFLSLAGRYCVLMPNTPRGGGVSRKITNLTDRRRLKDLMSDLEVPEGMGVIVRTAGSERSKAEIKRDFEYLLRLWDDIRDLTLKSTAPALIYEEGNLIKRSIRDLYTRDLDEVIVDGPEGYHTAKAFMRMLMPSHAKRVKPYRDPSVPLLHRYQVESQIDAIHSPVVQLRSGGYVVINPTEALVAIDVNSGRSTKERNIEETALKTNLEAAEEIARQLRLRDLAGLIVIDFIDMEEHRNQAAVERKLKEAMRHDRARIQLGRISPFGLLELSRQRLRPSLLEASTQPCPHCNGTGHIRSTESTALHVLRAIEEEGTRRRSAEISVAVPAAIALYILNQKREALLHAEQRYGFRVILGNDDSLVPPSFRLERLRALTPAEIAALPPPLTLAPMPEEEDDEDEGEVAVADGDDAAEGAAETPEAAGERTEGERAEGERADGEEGQGRRRRRRRRRGRRGEERGDGATSPSPAVAEAASQPEPEEETAPTAEALAEGERPPGEPAQSEPGGEGSSGRKRRRRGRRGGRRRRREHGPDGGEPRPSQDGQDEDEVAAAEIVEYLPEDATDEDVANEVAAAEEAAPAPPDVESGPDSVPVSDAGDHPPPPAFAPLPPAAPAEPEAPPQAAASPEVPTHEVIGPPANPKRGWWRRVIDS